METSILDQAEQMTGLDGGVHAEDALHQPSVQEAETPSPSPDDEGVQRARNIVEAYLMDKAPEFRKVKDLREEVRKGSE